MFSSSRSVLTCSNQISNSCRGFAAKTRQNTRITFGRLSTLKKTASALAVAGGVAAGGWVLKSAVVGSSPSPFNNVIFAASTPIKSSADFPVVSPESSLEEKDWMSMPITDVDLLDTEKGEMKRKMELFIMGLQGKICKEIEELEEDRKFQVITVISK